MSTNQFAVSFVPEDQSLKTLHFYDLNELECKPYQGLYTIHFITRSTKDDVYNIQYLVGKFGNLIISGDVMLYGAFVSIDIKFDNPVFTDPFYKEIHVPSPYCSIDFQFSGQVIGGDSQSFLKSNTSGTTAADYMYYDGGSTVVNDSCGHQPITPEIDLNKKVEIEEKTKQELKRKITFK